MDQNNPRHAVVALREALTTDASSTRLQAALTAGTHPNAEFIEVLVKRCAVEPDFYVRDTLTWALIRQDRELTIERVLPELRSDIAQARSQGLHTLSKIGDARAWAAITPELLRDANDDVARAAWRTAARVVPAGLEVCLAETLSMQFNRGGREVQLSLSQAFVALGSPALPVVERAVGHADAGVRAHAVATERMMLAEIGEAG